MGLEAVKEEIIGSAKEQSNSIIAEARKEANRQIRDAGKKIEEMQATSEAELKKRYDSIKRQEIAAAELESKKMLLEAKKQVIDAVFAESAKRLQGLHAKGREEYTKKALERAKKDMDVAFVYCSNSDAKFLKGMNVEPINIAGGIIAENREKTIRVDYSFETMLQGIKETEMQNLSKILFG